jgi:hypothetical protein
LAKQQPEADETAYDGRDSAGLSGGIPDPGLIRVWIRDWPKYAGIALPMAGSEQHYVVCDRRNGVADECNSENRQRDRDYVFVEGSA